MPAVPTEVLNDDIKELKAEPRDIRRDMDAIKVEVHGIAVGLAELRAEFRTAIGVARWLATALFTLTVGGLLSAVWWASGMNTEVRNLDKQVAEIRSDVDKRAAEIRSDVAEIRAFLAKDREPAPIKPAVPPTAGDAPRPEPAPR